MLDFLMECGRERLVFCTYSYYYGMHSMETEIIKMKGPIAKCFGRSFVDGKLCLEATLTVALK